MNLLAVLNTWDRVEYEELSLEEQEDIIEAWIWLLACGFIMKISHRRQISVRRNRGKKKMAKRRMQGRATEFWEDLLKTGSSKRACVSEETHVKVVHQEPADAVDFMCINARNFIRSTKGVGPGKLSNDDQIKLAAFHTWTAFASLQSQERTRSSLRSPTVENTVLKTKNERLKRILKATKASMENLKEAAAKGAKAVEYKKRAKQAQRIIAQLKGSVRITPSAKMGQDGQIHGCTQSREVRVEELFRTASLQPAETAPPEEEAPEDSLNKVDIDDSNDEVEVVGPAE
ncbi:hypothetical protein ACOSP7_020736 [Xanthoceras sorbifolium]